MSLLYFATCDRDKALGFIRRGAQQPDLQDSPESIGKLLDLVAADVVRVTDPDYHFPPTVIPGTHWDESRRAEIVEACKPIKGGAP